MNAEYFRRHFCYLLIPSLCGIVGISHPSMALAATTLWFGSYTDDEGKLRQARYVVDERDGTLTSIRFAPYGVLPRELKIVEHDTNRGILRLEWPGNPKMTCTANRYSPGYYSGNWIEGTRVEPMVLKKFDRQDAERQGRWFEACEDDLEIIEHAVGLLASDRDWDRNDDRICRGKPLSIFCSLYQASIAVDGEYRHLRPAINAVRGVIERRHPKQYDHVLQDFNNADTTTLKEVHAVLEEAKKRLRDEMADRAKQLQ